ncbi:MAG: Holliday junction resolvase RuvX [Gammaproteobacteria bacterium]|nr:Holliday junction resolvase RuvX [Gammaproteobacteria bacterium]
MAREGTYLGFDFGLRRIGVAVGQRLTGTATPLTTLRAAEGRPDWETVDALVGTWRPEGIVVGIPLNMDGTEQALTHAARAFARELAARYRLAVHPIDERLSSIEAERIMGEERAAGRRRRYRKEDVDMKAAQLILETWLNR